MKYITPYDEFVQLNEAVGSSIVRWVQSGIVPKETFDHILQQDPSHGKFVDKMVEWFTQGIALPEILQTIQTFFALRNKKQIEEIQKFKTYHELQTKVQESLINMYASGKETYKKYGNLTYEITQNDDKVFVAKINSLADSVYFGDKRGWCVSDTSTSMFDKGIYFKGYQNDGAELFFILDKKIKDEKNKLRTILAAFFPHKSSSEIRGAHNLDLPKPGRKYLKDIGVHPTSIVAKPPKELDLSRFSETQADFIRKINLSEKDLENYTELHNGILTIEYIERNIRNQEHIVTLANYLDAIPQDVKLNITVDAQHSAFSITDKIIEYFQILEKHNIPYKFINPGDNVSINFGYNNPQEAKLTNKILHMASHMANSDSYSIYLDLSKIKNPSLIDFPKNRIYNLYLRGETPSLKGFPKEFLGNFQCIVDGITSLEGAPESVGGGFCCSYNRLTSLEGAPTKVEGSFNCSDNLLTSLEGAPKSVGGSFSCYNNKLTSLEGAPTEVYGQFYCHGNAIKFTEEDVRKVCKVHGKIVV